MQILVVGATGATGQLLVGQLLNRGHRVKAIVRSVEKIPEALRGHPNLQLTTASLLDLSATELAHQVAECAAVASCLGHNLTLKGIYGKPRRLVTDATRRLCNAIEANQAQTPVKFVLMNTAGNRNKDLAEPISFSERIVTGLIRLLLPPHPDNEQAAEFLRSQIGQNSTRIEWAAVRPDSLIDAPEVSDYSAHPSPTRSAIFNPGKTSRINVAHFMADLLTEDHHWKQWKGKMPVLYNKPISTST